MVTTSRRLITTKRPSGDAVRPSNATGSVIIGHGGAFGSEACHFFALALSASVVGQYAIPVKSRPLNRISNPSSGVNASGVVSTSRSVAISGRRAAAHFV